MMGGAISYDGFCELLATTAGGYTLWLGAGAAKAICPKMPTWAELTDKLAAIAGKPFPAELALAEYPAKLDWIAGEIGHEAFRRELHLHLIEPLLAEEPLWETVTAQAVIGTRAGGLVSFNVETISATPFCVSRGGSYVMRPYLDPNQRGRRTFNSSTDGGVTCMPVFYPHGLLTLFGYCVITSSEYARHRMSLAVQTAVSQCLGGDLVVLGMSFADQYLRDAVLAQRGWIRDVYWVASSFPYREWARVADVTCVTADYQTMWRTLAQAMLAHDSRDEIKNLPNLEDRARRAVLASRKAVRDYEQQGVPDIARRYASNPNYSRADLHRFAGECLDLGVPVPQAILDDARYKSPATP